MSSLAERIENDFSYHAPRPDQPALYTALRAKAKELALLIAASVPAGREQAVALTQLETAVMWANAGIARAPEDYTGHSVSCYRADYDAILAVVDAAHPAPQLYVFADGGARFVPIDAADPTLAEAFAANAVYVWHTQATLAVQSGGGGGYSVPTWRVGPVADFLAGLLRPARVG